MEELLPFLQKFEVWIYVLLGIVALIPLQQVIAAWKSWRESLYGLEREISQRRFSTALTVLVLLIVLIFMEFVVVSFVAPSYPQVASLPTPTLDLLATPTVTLPVAAQAVTAASLGAAAPGSADAAGTSAGTGAVTVTAQVIQEGCIPGQIEWTVPKVGQEISGTIELKGTVNVPNLGFYKYEYSKQGDEVWSTIAAGNQPKVNGQIGFWDTSSREQGDYLLRLVVADNQNKLFPACKIAVRVVKP